MIWVTHANHAGAYRLSLVFSDGAEGEVDLKEVIANGPRPIFQELRNVELFKKFRVDRGYGRVGQRIGSGPGILVRPGTRAGPINIFRRFQQ